jgi:hypothetical protein
MLCLSYYLLYFSSTNLENKRVEQVLPGGREGKGGVSKQCKNDKIKRKKEI